LAPAYYMSRELPEARAALPVIKVLYRNTSRIQEFGGPSKEVLHAVCPAEGTASAESLREAVHARSADRAEATLAGLAQGSPRAALDALLNTVEDETEVHRTVLPYRAYDLLGLIGPEYAHTLLRQSVRYCVKNEQYRRPDGAKSSPSAVLPWVFDQFKLEGRAPGQRQADDAWVDRRSRTICESTPEQAAEAAASALAEGFAPEVLGEAMALAANQLVLRDIGRYGNQVQPGKPEGSVHGDSIGVHACDSANAWHNMALAVGSRNAFACLILGCYQVALDRVNRGGDFLKWQPRPHGDDLESVPPADPEKFLAALHEAVRGNDQARACAVVQRL